MHHSELFDRYIDRCRTELAGNSRVLSLLKAKGLTDAHIIETFKIGYAGGTLAERIGENTNLLSELEGVEILHSGKEVLKGRITVPLFDEEKRPVNLIGWSIWPRAKNALVCINASGLFNAPFLAQTDEIVIAEGPLEALLLIQHGISNATFLSGDDENCLRFIRQHQIREAVFAFDGRERLFHELTRSGISTQRVSVDVEMLRDGKNGTDVLKAILGGVPDTENNLNDTIQIIENGFLFRFPLLHYRVIGNFNDYTTTMKANIKAFTETEAFVDSLDLYKHRDRQNFIFNLADRFEIRDQIQLEQDLAQIVEVIEKHKERKRDENTRSRPELTDWQKEEGMKFLTNPHLMDEIDRDYEKLGYVWERKNKLLLYLVMTSRLTEHPLHAIAVSRSGAGKSRLAEVTESLCPPEDAVSVSDLSANALYYYGEDDLKHRFIVIGETAGREGSDYPLRELISRRSITKAVPMKDAATGQIRTVTITVNGPISLVETTTSSEVNQENLNRCFVIGIDESEEQTQRIQERQRKNYTVEGFLLNQQLEAIQQKHIYAQRLLKPIQVFNPFAELLTFPSRTLRSRRDNEKFLRLITVICFLHQYQRKVKRLKTGEQEGIEYIECSLDDYRIAYELLSDGVLENTLDDLPQAARKLFEIIRRYVHKRSVDDTIPKEKIIFERKDIREFSSWSFAQVRNNFRILREYEYIRLIKAQNGIANQYRLGSGYGDPDYMGKIVSPDELEKKTYRAENRIKNLNRANIPE